MATRPTIEISFKQLATTLIQRSERGTAILLLNDSTAGAVTTKVYKTVADIDESLYTAENLAYIKACMAYAPYEVVVISADSSSFSTFAPEILKARSTGWIAVAGTGDEETVITKSYDPGKSINELGVLYSGTSLWGNEEAVTVEHNGVTYTSALKVQNECEITFELPKNGTITFVTYKQGTSDTQLIIDGMVVTVDGEKNQDGSLTSITSLTLDAGIHTITRGASDLMIFGIVFEYTESQLQSDLAVWIKAQENMGRTYKAIGTAAGKDCKHYVYFNQTCYDNDGNELSATEYLPNLLGIIASCNVTKGCTNFLCTDLSRVDEVEDIDAAIAAGQFVLTNDVGGVRIVTGINSLTTLNGNTATEDMQYIETVEAMDLIRDDIRDVFKTTYQGKFKNKYKYQMLFIGAVNQYYSQLANEDILDDEFDNKAEIDATEQRSAWLGTGKTEAADWDDDEVRRMSFKRSLFLASNIKILNCMENLKFTVTLE